MLLILTGDVEIGKTTWLTKAADALTTAGICCDGVLAPGVWERKENGTFDKLGIDNVLLPSRERVPFARRADLARIEGLFDEHAQSAKAQLKWHIYDDAIRRVNEHFDQLAHRSFAGGLTHSSPAPQNASKRMLIVDELGQLELLRGEGLTGAVAMLEAGHLDVYKHAIIIVRDKFGLVEAAEQRFASAWGGCVRIAPNDTSWSRWIAPLLAQ